MLRTLIIDNFLEFRSTQILKFEEGPHFLVGPNLTGETALFELTRRCLSRKSNPKISYIPDESKPAFVICKFKLNPELAYTISEIINGANDSPLPSSPTGSVDQQNKLLHSCCFVDEKQLFKLVCVNDNQQDAENTRVYIARYALNDNIIQQSEVSLHSTTPKFAETILKHLVKCEDPREESQAGAVSLIKFMKEHTELKHVGKYENPTIENILRHLEKVVVVTFPVRGHGPLLWNQNPEINGGYGKYKNASDAAVILQELLGSDDVNSVEADKTFTEITIPNKFVFTKQKKLKNGNSSKENEHEYDIVVEKNCHSIPLIKVPEGILEARHFSLILAHKKYQTICLEEPGLGMDHSMVKRMRDLLLRKQKDKTVIVISHKPSMIDFWAFDRLFVSRHDTSDNTPNHSVRRLDGGVIQRYQEENFKQMLFSSSVLFVEGSTDRMVLGAVFDEIMEMDLNGVNDGTKAELQQLQRLIAEINMIEIGGTTSYNSYKNLSDQISTRFKHWFVFDKDSIFISKPEVHLDRVRHSDARKKVLRACMKSGDGEMEELLNHDVTDPTNPGKRKLKNCLQLSQDEPPPPSKKRAILRTTYLPKQGDGYKIKDKHIPTTFNLGEDDPCKIETYLHRQIFTWKTGNLEDVIVTSIIDMGNEDGMELLRKIVPETDQKGKDPLKKGLMEMDKNTSQELSRHLLRSEEIKNLLKFLLYGCLDPPQSYLDSYFGNSHSTVIYHRQNPN